MGSVFVAEENCPPFSNHRNFWHPMALTQIKSFTIGLFGRLGSLCFKALPTSIFVENPWLQRLILRK
jgi:hypothetical protein